MTEPSRAALPPHLIAGLRANTSVDPFAAPAPLPSRRKPPTRTAPTGPAGDPGVMQSCQCSCSCSNDTTVPAASVTSAAAKRLLRCAACTAARHPLAPVQAPAKPAAAQAPKRAPRPVDPEDERLDRLVAQESMRRARTEAAAAFEKSLPAKFQRPLDEQQEPAVDDRLERLRTGRGGHGTSLLTYGVYGSGKTWTGYSYMRLAVRRGLLWPSEVRHGTEAEIMEPLVFAPRWEIADRMRDLLSPNLKMLLLDDVGNMSRWPDVETRHATYASVINWMWENDRALIITTNLELGQGKGLEQWIGVAAYERVRAMIGSDPVFRDKNKRAAMTAEWEKEWRAYAQNLDAA